MRSPIVLSLVVGLAACGSGARAPARDLVVPPLKSGEVPPLRWTIPSCPLRYVVDAEQEHVMEGAPPSMNQNRLVSRLDVAARPASAALELEATLTSWIYQGRHRPFAVPQKWPEKARITTDGARFGEEGEPTSLYRRFGTAGGLSRLFPPLPGAPGASVTWDLGQGSPPIAGSDPRVQSEADLHGTVRFERWILVSGVRAALLHLSGDATFATDMRLADEASATHMGGSAVYEGEYVVLESGRLLRADLRNTVKSELTAQGLPAQHHEMKVRVQTHLVSACDGPVDVVPPHVATPEEQAIDVVGALAIGVLGDKREDALAHLAPELRRKHGDDAIWGAIRGYVAAGGDRAWGIPVFVRDEDVTREGDTIVVGANGSVRDGGALVNAPMRFRVRGNVVESIHATNDMSGQELLDVSSTRLAPGGSAKKKK